MLGLPTARTCPKDEQNQPRLTTTGAAMKEKDCFVSSEYGSPTFTTETYDMSLRMAFVLEQNQNSSLGRVKCICLQGNDGVLGRKGGGGTPVLNPSRNGSKYLVDFFQ